MNKTEYVLLAEALKAARPSTHDTQSKYDGWENAVEAVADALARQAPAFNRELFLKNAGVTP